MIGGLVDIPSLEARVAWARRRWVILAVLAILLAAGALRLANIGWSYSNNGIDEGVMIERALMVDEGFALYSELPCDQAPLAFIVGSVFGGDVVSLRALTALVAVAAIACCMYASKRIGGNVAMLATGALLAVDFALVRESRLFSLDSLSTSFLAFSAVAFVAHLERRNLALLALAGLLAGISCSFKLIGGLALAGILVFIVVETVRGRTGRKEAALQLSLVTAVAVVPLAVLMLALGPADMIQGMILDQGHRGSDLFLKLSLLVYLCLCVAYVVPLVCARRLWSSGPRERFLLLLTLAILVFMLVQPLLFLHHMVYASPALAILAGVVVSRSIESKEVPSERGSLMRESKRGCLRGMILPALVASLAVSGGLSSYGLAAQGEPSQIYWAELVEQLSTEYDYVICGDPIIAAYADRRIPPEVVNVAERQYPELTFDRICQAVTEYDVEVVLICYYLNDFEELPTFLESHGYFLVPDLTVSEGKAALDLFQDGIDPVSLYVKSSP